MCEINEKNTNDLLVIAEEIIVEAVDERTGLIARRQIKCLYFEDSNSISIIGVDPEGNQQELHFSRMAQPSLN